MVANKIIDAQNLPEGEKVYLRKDKLGWRLIKPIKKDLEQPWSFSNCNWPNLLFGGWRNLIILLFILTVVLYHLHEDKLNMQSVEDNCMGICRYQYMINTSLFDLPKRNNVGYVPYQTNFSVYGGVAVDADK